MKYKQTYIDLISNLHMHVLEVNRIMKTYELDLKETRKEIDRHLNKCRVQLNKYDKFSDEEHIVFIKAVNDFRMQLRY